MIGRIIASEALRAAEESPGIVTELLDKLRNPADWAGEFTIEMVFAVVGVHAIHKVAHSTVHAVMRRTRTIGRYVAGKVRTP